MVTDFLAASISMSKIFPSELSSLSVAAILLELNQSLVLNFQSLGTKFQQRKKALCRYLKLPMIFFTLAAIVVGVCVLLTGLDLINLFWITGYDVRCFL